MKETIIHIPVTVKEEAELTPTELQLLDEARRATYRSYAPYSHFSVGAAVELADGTIVAGSNQENAAYPSGLCAERTAVFYAGSRHPDTPIRRLCITARDADGQPLQRPIAPCGACRQFLTAPKAFCASAASGISSPSASTPTSCCRPLPPPNRSESSS